MYKCARSLWKIKDSRTLFGILPRSKRKEIKFDAHQRIRRLQSTSTLRTKAPSSIRIGSKMRLEDDIKLDYSDVLISPKRSTLGLENG